LASSASPVGVVCEASSSTLMLAAFLSRATTVSTRSGFSNASRSMRATSAAVVGMVVMRSSVRTMPPSPRMLSMSVSE
jgi:hypothetical protein